MAKFQPGEPKKGGRVKGVPNRTTEQLRSALLQFIDDNLEGITKDFKNLNADKRLIFFEKIIRHVLPPPASFEKLSEEQLKQLHEYLLKKYDNEQADKN